MRARVKSILSIDILRDMTDAKQYTTNDNPKFISDDL